MRIGVFSDSHDHLENLRRAVAVFNEHKCELVIFAGDLVSTIAVPPLRQLRCPFLGCFGDNEGNRLGIHGGMKIVGPMAEPPFGFRTHDGFRILVTHERQRLRGLLNGADVVIFGHTHRAAIYHDAEGRLFLNPGETGGWTCRRPSVALLETQPLDVRLIPLA